MGGKIITHYKNKNQVKSNLERVRAELLSEPQRSSPKVSRLNYRDESSGPIQSSSDTTFGKHWNNRKSRKQKLNRKQRKKKKKKKKPNRKKKKKKKKKKKS